MKSAGKRPDSMMRQEMPIAMKGLAHSQIREAGGSTRRPSSALAAAGRTAALLACLLFVSACARLPDMVPDWLVELTGGEGKIAEPVSSSVIDAPAPVDQDQAPAPVSPPPSEIRVVQSDLAELGYQPGPADGTLGPMTTNAIEAYQQDAGMEVNGQISPELVASLAAAPRPKKPTPVEDTEPPEEHIAGGTPSAEDAATEDAATEVAATEDQAETPVAPAPPPIIVENADIWPLYGAGDKYIWSTGQTETVARIIGNELIWEISNGVRVKADRNFLIPPSTWTSPTGTGEAIARIDPLSSWPLVAEKPLIFKVEENGNVAEWTCESLGGQMASVPAGQFKAVALACERNPAPTGEWVRRIWLYAPAVRHYVARTDILPDGQQISKYLVGIRPGADAWPPAVRAGLERAIQTTLNESQDGERNLWSSTVVEEEFEIRPGPVRGKIGSHRCRNFVMMARSAKGSRLYPAIACVQGADKIWRIPGGSGKNASDLSGLINAG